VGAKKWVVRAKHAADHVRVPLQRARMPAHPIYTVNVASYESLFVNFAAEIRVRLESCRHARRPRTDSGGQEDPLAPFFLLDQSTTAIGRMLRPAQTRQQRLYDELKQLESQLGAADPIVAAVRTALSTYMDDFALCFTSDRVLSSKHQLVSRRDPMSTLLVSNDDVLSAAVEHYESDTVEEQAATEQSASRKTVTDDASRLLDRDVSSLPTDFDNLAAVLHSDGVPSIAQPVCELVATYSRHRSREDPLDMSLQVAENPWPIPHSCGILLRVECESFSFDFKINEPYFLILCLVDVESGLRVSEELHMCPSDAAARSWVKSGVDAADVDLKRLTGYFRVSKPNRSLMLLVRVEKLLQGDVDECFDVLCKDSNPKALERASQNVREICADLGQYKMPLAWTAVPLFTESNDLETQHTVTAFYRQDVDKISFEDLLPVLRDLSRTTKKLKTVSGQMRLRLRQSSGVSPEERFISTALQECGPDDTLPTLDSPTVSTPTEASSLPISGSPLMQVRGVSPGSAAPRVASATLAVPGVGPDPGSPGNALGPPSSPNSRSVSRSTSGVTGQTQMPREVEELPNKRLAVFDPFVSVVHTLYVYPQRASFASFDGKARTIAVKMELWDTDSLAPTAQPLKLLHDRGPSLTSAVFTSVVHHEKNPTFYNEFKIALPLVLRAQHHLLFTFYHLTTKGAAKTASSAPRESVVGYAWLRLGSGGEELMSMRRLSGERVILNVVRSLSPGYLSMTEAQMSAEAKKTTFDLQLELYSSIMPPDDALYSFFVEASSYLGSLATSSHLPSSEKRIIDAIEGLQLVARELPSSREIQPLRYLHLLLNYLLRLLSTPSMEVGRRAFRALNQVLTHVQPHGLDNALAHGGRNVFLQSYVSYVFDNMSNALCGSGKSRLSSTPVTAVGSPGSDWVFEHVLRCWINAFQTPETAVDHPIRHSWFLFEVITKSLLQFVHANGRLRLPRHERLSEGFLRSLEVFVGLLVYNEKAFESIRPLWLKLANKSLAQFLCHLIDVTDRGFVLALAQRYVTQLEDVANVDAAGVHVKATELRVEFLRTLCGSRQFMQLNFPLRNLVLARPLELDIQYCERHFLAGLLLVGVGQLGQLSGAGSVELVRERLATLVHDERYLTDARCRSRIATLFFPLVTTALGFAARLHKPARTPTTSGAAAGSGRGGASAASGTEDSGASTGGDDDSGSQGSASGIADGSGSRSPLKERDTQELLVCSLQVLRDIDENQLRKWLMQVLDKRESSQLNPFMDLLASAVRTFQATKSASGGVRDATAAKRFFEERYQVHGAMRPAVGARLRSQPPSKAGASSVGQGDAGFAEDPAKIAIQREGLLCSEVGRVVLQCLNLFVDCGGVAAFTDPESLLVDVQQHFVQVVLALLSTRQSERVVLGTFAFLRKCLTAHAQLFFSGASDFFARVVTEVMHKLNSSLVRVRTHAASLLYFMSRRNFEVCNGNINRMKICATMAMSALLKSFSTLMPGRVRVSLRVVDDLVEQDVASGAVGPALAEKLKPLTERLQSILSDTERIESKDRDPEEVIDLRHKLAENYSTSPGVRVGLLAIMAEEHKKRGNFAEAAQCIIHQAALVSECLQVIDFKVRCLR
jgi:dedicator of cytokinesis protein 6/7/8